MMITRFIKRSFSNSLNAQCHYRLSIGAFFLASLTSTAYALPYQQDAGTGHVVFEAEHEDLLTPRSGYSWANNFTAGYSGDSALRTSPTSGPAFKDPGYSSLSPQLDYDVNFVQAGTHYVWVRGYASASNNNSVHVGLDSNETPTSEALNFPVTSNWVWYGGPGVASFTIGSLGVHTVNVWMRETGFRIDKLIVTTDAGFTPTGNGPAESPRGSGGGGANQIPVADAGGPYNGEEGVAIGFDGSASFDLDGDPLTYSWDFGDGSAPGSGVAPSHSYAVAGSYTVSLTVNDGTDNSLASMASVTVAVPASNQTPVANAGGPYSGNTGAVISFDGSGSSDGDGDPLTYSWDFGDGSAPGSGVAPSHSYATAGSYTVSLTVNDGTENSAASTATVTVTDPAGGTPAFQQDAGTGHVVFEAEHEDLLTPRSGYSWANNFTAGYSGDSALRTSPTSGPAFKDPGYSSLSPQLDYDVNFVQTGTHYVWVRGYATGGGNNSVHVGLDGNETPTSEALNFPVTSNWVWYGGPGVASFAIGNPGVHTVNVWMRETGFRIDKLVVTTDAGFTPTGNGPAESPRGSGGGGANQIPVADAGGPYNGEEGVAIGFDGSASFDLDGDPLTYSWDFGDGSAPGSGVAPSHSYAVAGSYTVSLTVNDGTDNSLASMASVTVAVPASNQTPVANAGGPYSGNTGAVISFDGSGSSDGDGDPLTYSWDFGDGSAPGSGVAPSHSYATAGSYTVSLTVNDGTENSAASTATVTVTDPAGGTPAFQQDAGTGHVVFEAEHEDLLTPRSGYSWANNFTAGYSGDSALRTSPTSGPAFKDPGYSSLSPQLDYDVNFVQTGTHYVWVRGYATGGGNNSVHVGLDGNETPTSEALNFPVTSSWVWYGGPGVASFAIGSQGVHTVNVWMRETGFRIDKLIVTTDAGFTPTGNGPAESPRSPGGSSGGTPLFNDDFNDGNALGWTAFSECVKGSANWSVVSGVLVQSGECRGFSTPEGVDIATYLLSDTSLPAGVDIRLSLRSRDPATDGVGGNDTSRWKYEAIGILFGYQDDNNYYRFEMDGMNGHRKLWRKQAGVYTELSSSPQSFVRDQAHNLRIVHQNDVIVVYIDNQQVMAVADSAFSSGPIAMFCARNPSCHFDDIAVTTAPANPVVGLAISPASGHAYSEYFVDTDNVLDVEGFSTDTGSIGGIRFVLDENGAGEQTSTDLVAPFTAQFIVPVAGDHTVAAYLLDGSAVPLVTPDSGVTLPGIATGGIHLLAFGDSISNGIDDDVTTDDVSADGRNTGGGYEPILNDYLTADNGQSVTVLNDGNSGEESSEGAARVGDIIARTPEVQAYLVFYGANDSGGSTPRAPGLNLNAGDPGYAGSFKDYIQQIIDAVQTAGKSIILAKAPAYLANSTRNDLVIQYNQVIDELIQENALGYVAPDLYSYFIANQTEYSADGIHPNGTGYQSMARIWCQGLNGLLGLICIP